MGVLVPRVGAVLLADFALDGVPLDFRGDILLGDGPPIAGADTPLMGLVVFVGCFFIANACNSTYDCKMTRKNINSARERFSIVERFYSLEIY
jgi:hypothetical protein